MNSSRRQRSWFWSRRLGGLLLLVCATAAAAGADEFQLPTANRFLYLPGAGDKFFVGTVGKPWTSGEFGCVRSEGRQMHEGLDIKCLRRDARGEPIDPVMATADGTVAYISTRAALSNYGKYMVLRHRIEGLEIDSLYAHLSRVRDGLRVGQTVRQGEIIATMGRTANTRETISRQRAHVHFELNLFLNDNFPSWYQRAFPRERNDHGEWNGQNLFGLDPRLILLEQRREGPRFSLLRFIQSEPALFRMVVRSTDFPFLRRYRRLVEVPPSAGSEAIAGYEVDFDYNGVPVRLIPRPVGAIKTRARYQLLSVDAAEERRHPCRHYVTRRHGRWELTPHGRNLAELLLYPPARGRRTF